MRAAILLFVLGCAAAPAGLDARLDVEPAPDGITLTLQLRNASTSPLSIIEVDAWDEEFPDFIHVGAAPQASMRIERLSGAVPRSFALLDGPLHSMPGEWRRLLLQAGESRSFPKVCLLPPGEYEATATYLGVDGDPLTTAPLRFRVEGTLRR